VRRLLPSALALLLIALPAAARQSTAEAVIARAFQLLKRQQASAAERLLSPIARDPAVPESQRARASRFLGQAYLDLGRRADAGREFARSLDAALAAADRREAGWTRLSVGDLHYQDGHIDQARAAWDLAREDFVAAGDAHGEFEVVDDIENSVSGLDRRPYAERCLAIAREQQEPLLEARARERWGGGLLDAGLPGPALVELERAAALMRPLGRRADPHFGDTLAMLGWALREHGASDRAVPIHREAIRIAQARGDLDSLMWNYVGLGISLAQLGHLTEAETETRRGLDVARRKGASTNIRLLMQWLGWVQVKRHRWQDAVLTLETAEAMPVAVSTAIPLVHLAQAYRGLGRLDDALDRANRAVDLAERLGLRDNELEAVIERAHVLSARDEPDAASDALAPAIDRLETYRANLAPVDFLKQGFGDRFTDAYGLRVERLSAAERDARVDEALAMIRLSGYGERRAQQLSGGERQRVAIARALMNNPRVLFADEPTGNLDSGTGAGIADLIFGLNAERGATLFLVTHEESLARRCSRMLRMADGKIVETV